MNWLIITAVTGESVAKEKPLELRNVAILVSMLLTAILPDVHNYYQFAGYF